MSREGGKFRRSEQFIAKLVFSLINGSRFANARRLADLNAHCPAAIYLLTEKLNLLILVYRLSTIYKSSVEIISHISAES